MGWLRDPVLNNLLEEVDIETSTKFELFDVLDVDDGGELGLDELIGGLMRLRGPISKSEIVAIRLKVQYMTKLLEGVWEKLGCNEDELDSPSTQVVGSWNGHSNGWAPTC